MDSSADRYARLLDRAIRSVTSVPGGDIGASVRIELEDGTQFFAKHYPTGDPAMAAAEAHGLAWLGETGTLRVPEVVAVTSEGPPQIVLEWIDQRPRVAQFDESLGRGLAALHSSGAPQFGLGRDNYIGSLPQHNQPHESWPDFYGRERIAPQLELARRSHRVPEPLARKLERLIETMGDYCGPDAEPARLHGDLWSGNLITDERGMPCLIDPAVYGGHREMDLAMMRLFGGFSARVFDAYLEAAPLAPGHEERVALWQLYPLLVHVNLFGGSYVDSVAAVVEGLV
ncbi:MAG: fructosamine kinase family protein [Deltaproteobacteria bacterium]|nr:fructosamine kinase family protein [Deltaproteobacteria bacterium]